MPTTLPAGAADSKSAGETTRAKRPKKIPAKDRARGKAAADKNAGEVAWLSPRERRRLMASLDRSLLAVAPSLEVAESDLFRLLLLVGAEFVARYYPNASDATIHVSERNETGSPRSRTMLSLAVPVTGASK